MLHLSLAWMKSNSSRAASLNWSAIWPSCSAEMPNPEAMQAAFAEAAAWDKDFVAGIAAYREFPYQRQMPDPPAVWEEGETRLLDYGGTGPTVLFIPSLINRAYILDLMEGGSMLRFLAQQDVHPYLLDWGWPGEAERKFSLTDYIAGRLERAVTAINGPMVLAGYCMGGLLALASALRLGPGKVVALALLATPWDFHAADPEGAKRLGGTLPALEPMMNFSGTLPIDALNTLFAMIDPFGIGEKYRDFAAQDKTALRARRFVAMEDWLADGVPLAAPAARETLGGWYGANAPARLERRVAGLPVDPSHLQIPSFCAFPAKDRLVPAASARALAALLPRATVQEPKTGHIGMVAGTNAQSTLWQPFASWLHGL